MLDIIMTKIVPVNAVFLIGYILKKRGVLKSEDGGAFLKLNFHILIPAMLFSSMKDITLTWRLLLYPLMIFGVQGIMYLAGESIYRVLRLSSEKRPVVIASLMIMNTGFILPFFIAFYGQEDIWRIGLFDLGNALIAFSFVYNLFLTGSPNRGGSRVKSLLGVLKTPPVVGMVLGIGVSFFGIEVPVSLDLLAKNLAPLVGPVVMLALGLYFNPETESRGMTVIIAFTKFILGVVVATGVSKVFSLEGLDRAAIYLMACSPVGANVLTFSVLTDSDIDLASGVVSFSIVLNLLLIPILMLVLSA